MQPRFPNRCDDYLAILALLFSRGIWLYSAHTSLDANPKGPVRWLADDLRLASLEILEPAAESGTGLPESGFGFTGLLSEALPYADFCRVLARVLGADAWQACGPKPESLRRVACCPGSGGALVQAAIGAGADVFITGDFKYHAALDAVSAGLRVLDVGHFVLEEEMMRRFSVRLEQDLGLPVRFFPGQDPLRPDGPHWS
jgi:putative NIF3 family GTP cyclohydrolase 1 type 2